MRRAATDWRAASPHTLRRVPTEPYTPEQALQAFWAKVDKAGAGGCWLWTASRKPNGYGHFVRQRKDRMAHRYSWELHNGPIPSGKHVLHRCDVPWCVNPAHLWLGTHIENMLDMKAKGRKAVGEKVKQSILKEADVRAIRREFVAKSKMRTNSKELAKKYGVKVGSICAIIRGATWAHVK